MGIIVRAIGTGVGFIAEATSSNKHQDTKQTIHEKELEIQGHSISSDESTASDDSSSDSEDEKTWYLDNEAEKTSIKQRNLHGQFTTESLISMVTSQCSPPPYQIPDSDTSVILPQRRPGSSGRGFVRGYAPMLNGYGIDQDTFLTFVENFDLAIQKSPVLNVVYVSAAAAGLVPNIWAGLASTVVQVAAGAAIEYQRRSRGNTYLDQINEKLFKPRGLYAVIMTYHPNASRPVHAEQADINELMNPSNQSKSLLGPKLTKGDSYGDLELPESAELVFPGISAEQQEKLLHENKLKKSARWTNEYIDRRTQARWTHQNPESKLNPAETPTFANSLADPNHPAFAGSWPTLFSGGRIAPRQKASREEKRAGKAARKEEKRARKGRAPKHYSSEVSTATATAELPPPRQQAKKQKKKTAKSNVLYLMIVPIPESERNL